VPLQDAIRESERYFGTKGAEVSGYLNEYGILCKYRGRFEDGERHYVRVGGLLDGLGRYEESIPIDSKTLAYYEDRFGPEHFEVAATLNNLGMARAAQGELDQARALLGCCLAIKRKLFAADRPEVRLTAKNLNDLTEGH
jgi:tetratricopeptide (TPR) repeat protein